MSLWKIAWRSIQQRTLASTLTAISMALGVALVVAVLVIHSVVDKSFRRSAQGYDLIVGPKGSRLELVLNTVYHMGKPVGMIPFGYYTELADGRLAPSVRKAVPVCMGDNVKGCRVIGTLPDVFELEYQDGQKYAFQSGRSFALEGRFEAVLGAAAADKTGLRVGDAFRSVHGDSEKGHEHAGQSPFKVAGILKPTGTPVDRAVFVNLGGFFQLHDLTEHYYDHKREGAPNRAYPIGTATAEMLIKAQTPEGGKYRFAAGRNLSAAEPFEAVVGAAFAAETGFKPGDSIWPTSAVTGPNQQQLIRIVGVLEPTKSPHDRGVFLNAEGYHRLQGEAEHEGESEDKDEDKAEDLAVGGEHHGAGGHGSEAKHHKPGHPESGHHEAGHHDGDEDHEPAPFLGREPEVSAILVVSNDDNEAVAAEFPKKIAELLDAQAVAPAEEIARLLEGLVGNIQIVLLVFAILIVVVAGIGILVSIYNSMNDRRHEIAVMRALGARRGTVMAIILLESILLALGGGAIGLLLGHGLTAALAPVIAKHTHVLVNALQFQSVELILIPGLVTLASLVGYLPAVMAYRTDVAQALISTP